MILFLIDFITRDVIAPLSICKRWA